MIWWQYLMLYYYFVPNFPFPTKCKDLSRIPGNKLMSCIVIGCYNTPCYVTSLVGALLGIYVLFFYTQSFLSRGNSFVFRSSGTVVPLRLLPLASAKSSRILSQKMLNTSGFGQNCSQRRIFSALLLVFYFYYFISPKGLQSSGSTSFVCAQPWRDHHLNFPRQAQL